MCPYQMTSFSMCELWFNCKRSTIPFFMPDVFYLIFPLFSMRGCLNLSSKFVGREAQLECGPLKFLIVKRMKPGYCGSQRLTSIVSVTFAIYHPIYILPHGQSLSLFFASFLCVVRWPVVVASSNFFFM